MAITVKHLKVSTVPDAGDDTLVEPSDWNADHQLTGTVPVANGGTGASTANDGFNALAPSQTGNSGKYLTTNGTDTSWSVNPLGTVTSVAATAGTGISVTGSPITTSGTLTITNTAPDQTVSIASGTGISATGTYPAFTVTNTLPDLTVALTGAGTTVVTGTYPNFTVTSNDAFVGTVTSVAATAGTGISITGSPITTSGTLNITNTAPDQTVVLTAGTGISTSGTYPNFTITNTSPSLGGDVVGPASATDNAVARYDTTTGKLLQNSVVTVGDTGAVAGVTTLAASTSVTTPIVQATNSAGLALRNSAGTTQISMGGGGGDNVTIAVATNINGANAQIDISPTGTGHVHIKPTGTGSLEIAPTNAGTINNMVIGGTTPLAITGTTITANTQFSGAGTGLTGTATSLSIGGNAATVTNGFYTTSSFNLGTTSIAVNRASASQTLTGISIDGNAGTATNGVVTTGSYADPAWITSLAGSKITGTLDGGSF